MGPGGVDYREMSLSRALGFRHRSRDRGTSFDGKQEAEQHGLELCKAWVGEYEAMEKRNGCPRQSERFLKALGALTARERAVFLRSIKA